MAGMLKIQDYIKYSTEKNMPLEGRKANSQTKHDFKCFVIIVPTRLMP